MEHSFTLRSIIKDAQREEKSLFFALLNLKTSLILCNIVIQIWFLSHYNIPSPLTNYLCNLYWGLKAQVKARNWCTPYFEVRREVFQDDTLSPLIFLLAINPFLVALQSPNIPGYPVLWYFTDGPAKLLLCAFLHHVFTHKYCNRLKTRIMNSLLPWWQ